MKSSELLKMARERLWDGKDYWDYKLGKHERFICLAISIACNISYGEYEHPHGKDLRQQVLNVLGGDYTLEQVIAKRMGIAEKYLLDVTSYTEIQQKRSELIDKLIAEYEEKGD